MFCLLIGCGSFAQNFGESAPKKNDKKLSQIENMQEYTAYQRSMVRFGPMPAPSCPRGFEKYAVDFNSKALFDNHLLRWKPFMRDFPHFTFLGHIAGCLHEVSFFVHSSGWGKVGRAFFERQNAGLKHENMPRECACLLDTSLVLP